MQVCRKAKPKTIRFPHSFCFRLACLSLLEIIKPMKQSFTILSNRLLDRELQVVNKQVRSKSESTPNAQIVTQCSAGYRSGTIENESSSQYERIKRENTRLFYLIEFMNASACRITEALSIKPTNCTSSGHVLINCLKGGKQRIVSSGMATEFIKSCASRKISPWSDWNRFFVYREMKKFGIGIKLNGRVRKSITHSIRHNVAKSIKRSGMSIEVSKQALGHQSINSTAHYHE
jgi:Phage integrase family